MNPILHRSVENAILSRRLSAKAVTNLEKSCVDESNNHEKDTTDIFKEDILLRVAFTKMRDLLAFAQRRGDIRETQTTSVHSYVWTCSQMQAEQTQCNV